LHAAQVGTLRLYAADHVYQETYEKLPRIAKAARVSPAVVRQVFEQEMLPLICFVSVPTGPPSCAEVAAVALRDPDDVPTAELVVLLAPCLALSGDADLRDSGLASPSLLAATEAVEQLAAAEGGFMLMGLATYTAGALAWGSARGASRLLKIPPWLVATGVVALGIAALAARDRRHNLAVKLGPFASRTVGALAQVEQWRAGGTEQLGIQTVASRNESSLPAAVAGVLAGSREPMLASDVHHQVVAMSVLPEPPSLKEVRAQLTALPMFVREDRSRWQLGRLRPPRHIKRES